MLTPPCALPSRPLPPSARFGLVLLALGLLGCKPKSDDSAGPDPLRVETQSVVSDENGEIHLDVAVKEGERFQVVQHDPAGGVVFTDSLTDPSGNKVLAWEDWQQSEYSYTEAVWGANHANTTNWPVREEDGPAAEGTWRFLGDTLTSRYTQKAGVPVEITIAYRKDADQATGKLHAVVAYCTGLAEDTEVVSGVETAVAAWITLYGTHGIELTVEYANLDLSPDLPDTYEGVQAYQDLMAQYTGYPLLVVIGDTIGGDEWVYGEAAAIPGPIIATPITAVEVAWMAHAGSDLKFTGGEADMMAETMGHEVGHYLGLFHPVEDGFTYWDYLDDTEDCTSRTRCEDALGTNLMFPYPICAVYNACDPQDQLSAKQVGVIQHYLGVE